MTGRPHIREDRFRRVVLGSIAVLTLCVLMVAGSFGPASAQGFGWFGNLFGGMRPQQSQPAYPGYDERRVYIPRRKPRPRPVEQVQKPKPPAKEATAFVYVIGDSLGQLLANGLDDALSDRSDVAVIHKARGSTGLVTTDYFDWPKAVDDMLAAKGKSAQGQAPGEKDKAVNERGFKEKAGQGKTSVSDDAADKDQPGKAKTPEKIDVAVMMIGVNDRQAIRQDGKTYQPGSSDWTAIYRQRVLSIDEAFRKKGVPLVWVGVPITKSDDFADDMAAFNDIYREAAAKTGATYVDTWEAFSDDNGDFDAFGPDVNGQTVRLRSADGIHFTRAGARKLAHFVETHVRRDLDGKAPVPELPTDAPAGIAEKGKRGDKPVVAAKPEAGPIKSLTELPSAGNGQLVDPDAYRDNVRDALVESSLVRGQPHGPPMGRADDFRWPSSTPVAPAH